MKEEGSWSSLISEKLDWVKEHKLLTALAVVAELSAVSLVKRWGRNRKYRRAAAYAKTIQYAKSKKYENLKLTEVDPEKEILILNSDITTLLSLLDDGKITSVEIVTVFVKRSLKYGRELNLTTTELFSEALAEAKASDERRKSGAKIGRLEGIPITFKDQFHIKGTPATLGLIRLAENITETEWPYATFFKEEGAIILAKTNTPQNVFHTESHNNLWGKSINPWNKERTAGGSTGGGAAMVAARCSPLEMGTDTGGSIRGPCQWNGIFGFRPTSHRVIMNEGVLYISKNKRRGQQIATVSGGPMGRSVDDLKLITELMFSEQMFNLKPYMAPLTFNTEAYESSLEKKLTFGFLNIPEFFELPHAVKRSFKIVREALEAKGYEVKEVDCPLSLVLELMESYIAISMANRGVLKEFLEELGEKPMPYNVRTVGMSNIGWFGKKFVLTYFKIKNQRRLTKTFTAATKRSDLTTEHFQDVVNRELAMEEFFKIWDDAGVDVLIDPGFIHPAAPHGKPVTGGNLFLGLWAAFNAASGVVPVTQVQEDEQSFVDSYKDYITLGVNRAYTNGKGLPVGVQITAKPYRDELCLAGMKVIETALKEQGAGIKFPEL